MQFRLVAITLALAFNATGSAVAVAPYQSVGRFTQQTPATRFVVLSPSRQQLHSPSSGFSIHSDSVGVNKSRGGVTPTDAASKLSGSSTQPSAGAETQKSEAENSGSSRWIAIGILTALLLIVAALGAVTTTRQIRRRHYRRLL